jgi:hypothetical protein
MPVPGTRSIETRIGSDPAALAATNTRDASRAASENNAGARPDDTCICEAASTRAALPPRSPWTTGSRVRRRPTSRPLAARSKHVRHATPAAFAGRRRRRFAAWPLAPRWPRLRFSGAFLAPLGARFGLLEASSPRRPRSTEPKVRGSNPLGRAYLRGFGRFERRSHTEGQALDAAFVAAFCGLRRFLAHFLAHVTDGRDCSDRRHPRRPRRRADHNPPARPRQRPPRRPPARRPHERRTPPAPAARRADRAHLNRATTLSPHAGTGGIAHRRRPQRAIVRARVRHSGRTRLGMPVPGTRPSETPIGSAPAALAATNTRDASRAASENNARCRHLQWPRRGRLKWPHLASVVGGVDVA